MCMGNLEEARAETMAQPVLDLGLLGAASKGAVGTRGEESKFDDVMALQEEPIKFKKGHTIAVLKAFLEDEYDLKQEQTVGGAASGW
ncbi:hypothetical protein ON010_g10526 [Phytophthora cinnamomi]|nr:hypothetical protein ON010_g10526 [Phytophthora cinnamomi]